MYACGVFGAVAERWLSLKWRTPPCAPLQTSVTTSSIDSLPEDRRPPTSGPHDDLRDVACPAGGGTRCYAEGASSSRLRLSRLNGTLYTHVFHHSRPRVTGRCTTNGPRSVLRLVKSGPLSEAGGLCVSRVDLTQGDSIQLRVWGPWTLALEETFVSEAATLVHFYSSIPLGIGWY